MSIYRRTAASAAVAFELGNHIDDLTDSEYRSDRAIELPDAGGEAVGYVADTLPGGSDHSFIVLLEDGRKVRVTCEEMQEAHGPSEACKTATDGHTHSLSEWASVKGLMDTAGTFAEGKVQ